MKRIFIALLIALPIAAQTPKVELLSYRTTSLCNIEVAECLTAFTDVRILKITASASGATAYQIQLITPDRNNARRTWSYVIARDERRISAFTDNRSATFFVIPIDMDIPILDIWVTTLVTSGEPFHQVSSQ